MNMLATERHNITLALTQAMDVEVHSFIPGRPTPPCIVIEPGGPYLEEGETYCDFNVRHSLILLADNATNETATQLLDQMICECIDALDKWNIESVDQPSQFEINNNVFLGTRIDVVRQTELTI